MVELIHEETINKGIHLVLNEAVEGFGGKNRVESVETDKQSYNTDFVLVGIGIQPNTEFLNSSGIHLNDRGAIYVNPYQETNIKNVYAAGDCATNYHRIKQINDYIPIGTTANQQGRIGGANKIGRAS